MRWRFLKEAYSFWKLLCRYNASVDTENDIEKYEYLLLRMTHTIEKGLSLHHPRKGFGRVKVDSLLDSLWDFQRRYGHQDGDFIKYPLAAIRNYIRFSEAQGIEMPEIKDKYESLIAFSGVDISEEKAGVSLIRKDLVLSKCTGDFDSLTGIRHSIRTFSKEQVSKDVILSALDIARRTPSACNRQGWKTYVFQGDKSEKLLDWQGCCRGFEDEIDTSVLVTCNLKAFMHYEVHQAYVDGGLYAMNLINAFQYLGLGTIPLSVAFDQKKLKGLRDFGIPECEVPIVIVGIGHLTDEFKVAVSSRKEISQTNTFL